MTFEQFKQQVEAAGLQARECSEFHWKILGGSRIVNVWPNGRRGFGFGVGDHGTKRPGNLKSAIRAAGPTEPPEEKPPFFDEPVMPAKREHVGLIRRLWRWIWWWLW